MISISLQDLIHILPNVEPTIGLLSLIVIAHLTFVWRRAFQRGNQARLCRNPRVSVEQPLLAYPFVSVLVPAWREATVIEQCLRSLTSVEYPAWELIVIAGGPDGTYEAVERFAMLGVDIKLIRQEPGGKNYALDQGLSLATGTIIVALDADSLVEPGWLKSLIEPLFNEAAAVCGNYMPLHHSWVSRTEEMEKILSYCIDGHCVLQGSGSIAIRRDTLLSVGGFPHNVFVGVDWDLDLRVSQRGMTKAFAETAVVSTHRPATLNEFWKNEVRWRRAHMRSIWRHRSWLLESLHNGISSLRFYFAASFITANIFVAIIAFAIVPPDVALWLVLVVALCLVWLTARRGAIAAAMAGYTTNTKWMLAAWAPMLLLYVTIAASIWAFCTLGRQTRHFQGPRPTRYAEMQSSREGGA